VGLEVARVGLHRCGAALPMLACAGAVGAAHLRAPGVGGNRGIMPNSNDDGGRGGAPPCADPPHPTVSRKAHNSNKTSPRLAEAPPSHVQHQQTAMPNRRTPDAPTMLYTEIGPRPAQDRSDSARPPRRRSTHNKLRERRPPAAPRNHRQAADPQQRNRSRRGIRPISRQSTTDLEPEYDRYRRGLRPISTRGAGHRATVYGRRPASPRARTTSSL